MAYKDAGASSVVPLGFSGDVRTSSVSVGSSSPAPLPAVAHAGRRSVVLVNESAVAIFLGGSDVTAANGIRVAAAGSFSADLGEAVLYAIAASGTDNDVRVLEVS